MAGWDVRALSGGSDRNCLETMACKGLLCMGDQWWGGREGSGSIQEDLEERGG